MNPSDIQAQIKQQVYEQVHKQFSLVVSDPICEATDVDCWETVCEQTGIPVDSQIRAVADDFLEPALT